MQYKFELTTSVLFGRNAIDQLGTVCKKLKARHVLIVTDPGIVSAGHLERSLDSLRKESINFSVFREVEENPTTKHVENAVSFAREMPELDLIIGLGGGSAMDCAKGVNFLLTNGGKMEDYWGIGKAPKPMLPSVGIPTTAGTGSEAQSFALISQPDTHLKMACGDKKARFRSVILDPTLVSSAPNRVAVATGIDAISHAVESYVTTKKTPFSQMLSREAWRLLESNFEKVLQNESSTSVWSDMLLGAHLAGAAIENSMLGAAHACANPITAKFDITHGIAVAIMLPHVIRFNGSAVNGHYSSLVASAGLKGNSASHLAERIDQINQLAAIPGRLGELHIAEDDLPELAKQAAKQWTGGFNPRSVGEKEFLKLYRIAF